MMLNAVTTEETAEEYVCGAYRCSIPKTGFPNCELALVPIVNYTEAASRLLLDRIERINETEAASRLPCFVF